MFLQLPVQGLSVSQRVMRVFRKLCSAALLSTLQWSVWLAQTWGGGRMGWNGEAVRVRPVSTPPRQRQVSGVPLTVPCACSMVSIALAASGASARSSRSRPKPVDHSPSTDSAPDSVPPSVVAGPNGGATTNCSAGVNCTDDSPAATFGGLADLFASASVSRAVMPLFRQHPGAVAESLAQKTIYIYIDVRIASIWD